MHAGPLPSPNTDSRPCKTQKNTHITFFNLTWSIKSDRIRLNPYTHSQWHVISHCDDRLCVFLLVWLCYVCLYVCVLSTELGPGAWNRWSARCLKDREGGFRVVTVLDSTGPCWLLFCLPSHEDNQLMDISFSNTPALPITVQSSPNNNYPHWYLDNFPENCIDYNHWKKKCLKTIKALNNW